MTALGPRRSGWQTYDSVVDAYDEAAVPRFAAPARELVAAIAPRAGACVLDVGTGTGLAGQIAREAVGSEGFVAGVDPSVPMLERAATRGVSVVAAVFPGLPFADGVFDAAIANLVLSHLGDYERGLADAVRVLRAGGRFGWNIVTSGEDLAAQNFGMDGSTTANRAASPSCWMGIALQFTTRGLSLR